MPIKVSINRKSGQISIEGEGFVGPVCVKELDKVEELLGKSYYRRKKREYDLQFRKITIGR